MKLSKYIDHTLLKQDATEADIRKLCQEAKQYHFASVCINPYWIPIVQEELSNTDIMICVVIGFPLGAMSTATKVFEAADAIKQGVDEIDMVINIGMLKDKKDEEMISEIQAVKRVMGNHTLKVIIETCLLTEEEKVRACQNCEQAGADFVKTSTGFSISGATVEDVVLMKKTVGNHLKVKAAGGVRNRKDMENMISAGADRIGTSRGVALVQDVEN